MNKKIIVVAIGLLTALPIISMAYESEEPNNDFTHATILKEVAKGSLGTDDMNDFYKFFVSEGLEIRLELTADSDVDIYLYNPEYQGVAYSCQDAYEYIAFQANMTGYWYVKATTTGGSATYDLGFTLLVDQHDGGYADDAGDRILKAFSLYPMEPVDNTPGRGNTGTLSPPSDKADWYIFSACEGQTIAITVVPTQDFDVEVADSAAAIVASSSNSGTGTETISYVAPETGSYFMDIFAKDGAGEGTYTMTLTLQGNNDGDKGQDAGNTMTQAMTITSGTYPGFMSYYDQEDWYAFNAASGQGISVALTTPPESDFNLYLYDPNGELVRSATYYGNKVLEYPADVSGTWKLQLDIFPGWDEKWNSYPMPIYQWGSGAYTLELEVGASVSPVPTVPQPDIVPVAQTIIVNNDPATGKDEYSYMAAIPAANYVDGGNRYVSPVIYEGDNTISTWTGTVDETTQYLVDDWNAYLSNNGKTASAYTMGVDPVSAAADLAEKAWGSTAQAVIAVDGSLLTDEATEVLSESATLNIQTSVKQVRGDSDEFIQIGSNLAWPFWVGGKWGIMHIALTEHSGANYEIHAINPQYQLCAYDWWPDAGENEKDDIWTPINVPGPWAISPDQTGSYLLTATLYSCDRYKIPVTSSESTIKVTVETDEPSYLWAYLLDPRGNIVAPPLPSWSGPVPAERVMPGNVSNGLELDYDHLWVEPHTTFTAEYSYPVPGKYTIIVTPRAEMTGSISYTVKAEIYEMGDRVSTALSAANGAVEASLKHAPLIYTAADKLSERTLEALNNLGVTKVTFVDLAGNDAIANELAANFDVERQTTMTEITSAIKTLSRDVMTSSQAEDYLVATSFASTDGYYAPAAYVAAYHGAPVDCVGAMGEAYHWATVSQLWQFYAGDWYHGSLSLGHLGMASQPIIDYIKAGELPPIGWDCELQWYGRIVESVYAYADSIGMDRSGLETYLFVAPKTDICFTLNHALLGNESTSGQFIGKTAAESAAYVSRSALYSALIFGNPDRNITTSSLMNFRDGAPTRANDGKTYNGYTGREITRMFGDYQRDYRGHCAIDNLLIDQRKASLYYYSGHGTGGGGVSYHPEWAGYTVNLAGYDAWHGYSYWTDDSPRSGGFIWYNVEGQTYNLYHFYYCDRDWENLHSQFVMWMSCTTWAHLGPEVYHEHGAVLSIGNANTGVSPHWELHDMYFLNHVLTEGWTVGQAYSDTVWRFDRDYTTMDPTSIYGSFSLSIDSVEAIYGDPSLTLYSPQHWTEPEPIDGFF